MNDNNIVEHSMKKGGINNEPSIARPFKAPQGQLIDGKKNLELVNKGLKDLKLIKKKEKKHSSTEIKRLHDRIDSQSKRINKLQKKLAQIISNQGHYLRVRLPNVLKNEERKATFSEQLKKAETILKAFNRNNLSFVSTSKDTKKRNSRSIGLFTHTEMQRLRRFLDSDHRHDYNLYRADKNPNLKNKQLLFFTKSESAKLKNFLKIKRITKDSISEKSDLLSSQVQDNNP